MLMNRYQLKCLSFLFQGEFGKKFEVKMKVSLDKSPLDFTAISMRSVIALTIDTGSRDYSSDSAIELQLDKMMECPIGGQLPHSYTHIQSNVWLDQQAFIGARYKSKCIDVIQMKQNGMDELSFTVLKSIEVAHHLNYVNFMIDKYFLVSWSLDGLVFVYNLCDWSLLCKEQMHNRYTYGAKSAVCTPNGRYIVSLGQSGNIVCMHSDSSEHLARKCLSLREAIGYDMLGGNAIHDSETGKRSPMYLFEQIFTLYKFHLQSFHGPTFKLNVSWRSFANSTLTSERTFCMSSMQSEKN